MLHSKDGPITISNKFYVLFDEL